MNKWDGRFLELARNFSEWSKDPSRKIGAIAVDPEKRQILAQGYNGFPRGIADDHRLKDRPNKYALVVHAEMNVIYNATYNGVCLDGASLYVWGLPCCSECAKGIVQVGIKRVVMRVEQTLTSPWLESWKLASEIFNETGVQHELHN